MCFCGLARAGGSFAPQAFDLTPRQGHANLAYPFKLDAVDRLGVEARKVDEGWRFSAGDRFQAALRGLQPDRGLFAIETGDRMALIAINHDDIAILVFG